MGQWIVVVEFDTAPSLSAIVAMQIVLGEDQISIMNSDCGFAVLVRSSTRPDTSLIERNSISPISLLVAELSAGAQLRGRPELNKWLGRP